MLERFISTLLLFLAFFFITGFAALTDIFEAGVWVGVITVLLLVLVLVLIIYFVVKAMK